MAKENAIKVLQELAAYARLKNARAMFFWQSEDSRFVRYANSAVSLNTREILTKLNVTVYGDRKKASSSIMTDAEDLDSMKKAVDKAVEMLPFAAPLTYQPKVSAIPETVVSEEAYDSAVVSMTSSDIIAFVEEAVAGLETEDILLSGNISSGVTEQAFMSTESTEAVYWRATDIGITLVLSSLQDKWEVNAEQFTGWVKDLDAGALHNRLSWLTKQYTTAPSERVPEQPFTVVFGPAALATYLDYFSWIGFNGGALKRGFAMMNADDIGQKVLSDKFTLMEDPTLIETYPRPVDQFGRARAPRPIFDKGVFHGFVWRQSDADEFGEKATGHDVTSLSVALKGGDWKVNTIQEFAALPRDRDVLYIPYLHYTGLVNPTKGIVTGTSRFGPLWLKKDGSIAVPYNVRFTMSLKDLFGDNLRLVSEKTVPWGESSHYRSRNPGATVVPVLACVDNINIELSNQSF
jgi:predicted Zn-dependent protease